MRSITELFEFLSNCTKETILTGLNDYCDRLVKPETLVWTESFQNWKQIKDVPELAGIIIRQPPPPPIVEPDSEIPVSPIEDQQKEHKPSSESRNVNLYVTIKLVVSVVVLFGLAFLISYWIEYNVKDKLRKEISNKVDYVFNGKTVVLDGEIYSVQGTSEQTELGVSLKNNPQISKFKGNKKLLNSLDSFRRASENRMYFPKWESRDKLYTVFRCSNGGFTIKKLTKLNDDSYNLDTYSSNDMGYKKPEYSYVAPEYVDDGQGNSFRTGAGFQMRNYRPSIQECYNQSFDAYTKNDKTGAYTMGKYIDIINFPDLRNEYYYMDNISPKIHSTIGFNSSEWHSIDNHESSVQNENYHVYISMMGKHYELVENSSVFQKKIAIKTGIGGGFLSLLLIILFFTKPKIFRH